MVDSPQNIDKNLGDETPIVVEDFDFEKPEQMKSSLNSQYAKYMNTYQKTLRTQSYNTQKFKQRQSNKFKMATSDLKQTISDELVNLSD